MNIITNLFKKISRNFALFAVILGGLMLTFYIIAKAVESSASSSTISDEQKVLTSTEIDKIIDDLKVSGNVNNIKEKLNEIAKRAELANNTALKEYAEKMLEYYEKKEEVGNLESMIEAMKKKNHNVESVDEQVSRIISADVIADDLQGAVSDETLMLLKSLEEGDYKKLQELMAEINSLVDLNDVNSLTIQQRALLDLLVINKMTDENLLDGDKLKTAKDTLEVSVTILESFARQEYSDIEYDSLKKGSEDFTKKAGKAKLVLPEQIMFMNGYFNLKRPPIMYDGHILIAVDDLYQYIDASIEYMYNNATMVIQSPGKTLEIVAGKNSAFLNDDPINMPVPILNFNNTIYMSAEFFGDAYNISYKYDSKHEFLIYYNNLVQLSDSTKPNQLNKG